uniref:Uncharacterized protein n=1 Tax=Arundo donax TaxID=35708 RepID=A0A0A9HHD0_ARUDO
MASTAAMPARVAVKIAALLETRGPMRHLYGELAPLLQQLREQEQGAPLPLADALAARRVLLRAVHDGSKIQKVPLLLTPMIIEFSYSCQCDNSTGIQCIFLKHAAV